MPISDTYIVQHLLAETRCGSIAWRESEHAGYVADSNGLRLQVVMDQSRTGRRVFVTVSRELERAHIAEPLSGGVLRPKYADADQLQLATLLRELTEEIAVQIIRREKAAREAAPLIRDSLFRQLLFAEVAAPLEDEFVGAVGKKF